VGDDAVDFSDPLVVAVSRRIDVSAKNIFNVLRDPKRHRDFDGSTMVRDSDASPIETVGDVFVMRMHNEEFGDYEMRNELVEYVPDRAIAWAPKRHDIEDDEDWNHRWGWRLAPDGEATVVTAFFDCRRVPDDGRRILRDGERWRPVLERSLERLEALFH
jgi:Polyketide cyclase / dehydrase and lipid transport